MLRDRHAKEILALAVPALGALAIDPLVSLVDTAFVGRLGPVPLGALGVNVSVFSLAFVVFNFLAYGTTPLVSDALARGHREEAARTVLQALTLAVLLGLTGASLLVVLAEPIAAAMGADGELLAPTLTYLRIRALAAPAMLLVTAGHGAFRGYGDTRTPLLVTIVLNLVNLVLDPILIFGLGWGIAGAAWGTVAAQWTGALAFLALVGRLGVRLAVPRPTELLPLLRVGSILSLRTFALIGSLTVATAVATRFGAGVVAAHHVTHQVWSFLALVVDALAIAGQILVARHLASGDRGALRAVAHRLLGAGVLLGTVLGVLLWLGRRVVPLLLTDEVAVLALVDRVWPIVAILQPINAAVFVWDGIFLGAKQFRFTAWSMVVAGLATCAVLAAVLVLDLGLVGVWAALVVLMSVRSVLLGWGYLRLLAAE